ncbi:THO complex subunit 5 [Marchantia polymorpha subsp. ruderalis]|uniref:THO complex subunit 5 n=1 Tax=Marchantia polymorpha TaxID=3197 RepID=A0A2R6XJB1_MARPO|nr:hypothetical protein MARPO_0012s0112 [Marchantia polymorpha]BBN18525.1 hypothetical protein Mp_8g03190 [Marchantia polymorpha subsp. ruderalis]PTQ46170.1 hypothetical protein MARPO_0012s0112 [Marchantia polymorpha]PTQ46171.1 hypothetical protein MARPO_0012s0112 [Marchantia polymorpha]BBN18526.1 hypothetical protein Mp_8g03190 [Marchantia polymorpha subsp. ruderalis]|eukprot:PTQ46169.1 hypothetical protein MARPO_0012s0112 [Marchantia polymorpha]
MAKTSYELLGDIRSSIEDILAKMLQVKKEGRGSNINLRELLTESSVMFVDLRQVNRLILQEEDRVKAETDSAKLPVDHTSLQLHNLLYEKNYYLKAIKACKDFKSKYPDIELVSEEDFFRDAPDELKANPRLKEDPHKLMLQRLNFELHQRKELCKHQEVLEARKKMLQESIANRRKFLSSLPGHLKALKKASLPVQQQLGILHTKRVKQHQLAELLPPPLYILYSQLLSQKEAFGENIELEIVGSAKDAQMIARQLANREANAAAGNSDESKLEEDAREDEDDSQRRRKRVKKSHDKETADGMGMYQVHPLTIMLQIFDNEQLGTEKANKLLTVCFEYLSRLNVVCAGIEGASQVTDSSNLLANLFPNDTGLDLPNQVSKLQAGSGFVYDENRLLRPYKWAQHLAGIDFLPETPPLLPDPVGSINGDTSGGVAVGVGLSTYRQQHRVLTVLQQLRSRKKAQLALKEQLESLSKLKQPTLKSNTLPWVVHSPKCTLRTWNEVEPLGQDHHRSSLYALTGGASQTTGFLFNKEPMGVVGLLTAGGEIEAGREDGELPSAVPLLSAGAPSSGSKLSSGKDVVQDDAPGAGSPMNGIKEAVDTSSKGSSGDRRSRREKTASVKPSPTPREGAGLGGLGSSLGTEFDALMEDGMEGLEPDPSAEEAADDTNGSKSRWGWESHGAHRYRAVLRRDNVPGGKRLELEAQVEVTLEYPLRPPHFLLRILPPGNKELSALPAPPRGVLDVTESMVIGEANVDNWFNELRAIEAEINIHLPGILSRSEVNYILAHQVALLSMLFDRHVDNETSLLGGQGPSSTSSFADRTTGQVGSRTVRGRDRRKAIAWNQEQGIFEHRS